MLLSSHDKIVTCLWWLQIAAVNGAGLGPSSEVQVTTGVKGMRNLISIRWFVLCSDCRFEIPMGLFSPAQADEEAAGRCEQRRSCRHNLQHHHHWDARMLLQRWPRTHPEGPGHCFWPGRYNKWHFTIYTINPPHNRPAAGKSLLVSSWCSDGLWQSVQLEECFPPAHRSVSDRWGICESGMLWKIQKHDHTCKHIRDRSGRGLFVWRCSDAV